MKTLRKHMEDGTLDNGTILKSNDGLIAILFHDNRRTINSPHHNEKIVVNGQYAVLPFLRRDKVWGSIADGYLEQKFKPIGNILKHFDALNEES